MVNFLYLFVNIFEQVAYDNNFDISVDSITTGYIIKNNDDKVFLSSEINPQTEQATIFLQKYDNETSSYTRSIGYSNWEEIILELTKIFGKNIKTSDFEPPTEKEYRSEFYLTL